MKKLLIKPGISISLATLCFMSAVSCNKSSSPGIDSQTSTLAYVLANGTNTTIFNSAVVKAGLDTVFSSPSIFTLFVPNDQTCNQYGYTQTLINGFTREQARQWVLYQTYAGTALPFESFNGKTEQKLVMANGDSVFVSGDSNRTYVNGYQFLNSELTASNGVMLALQNVLSPPQNNLNQLVNNDTSLSFLNEAILLATPIPDSLGTLLSTGGPFLLLAANNDAFRKLGYNSPSDLDTLNPDSLRSMVLLSMIPQRLFSYDISDSSEYTSAGDSTLLFLISGTQAKVQVLGSLNSSNAVSINTMAINGVLFKIDEVLGH
jgi:uncharacterized surface protein with fasciclin (FAS1) repeats